MWLGVPGHCFDPLMSIYEPMAFVLENVEKRQNYPDTLYTPITGSTPRSPALIDDKKF